MVVEDSVTHRLRANREGSRTGRLNRHGGRQATVAGAVQGDILKLTHE
jgi:hypothetical protein